MNEGRKFNRYSQLKLSQHIQLPEISRLYSLEPIGIRTPFTESVSSYLTRLAQEHCVILKKMIMAEVTPAILGERYQPEMLSKNARMIFGNSDAKPTIEELIATTPVLDSPLTLPELIQKLKLIQLSFERSKSIPANLANAFR